MTHKLLEGFRQFHAEEYGDDNGSMPTLVAEGQSPEYFIISCIDSRCNPGTIFKSPPGTFFGFKAMAAIVRPYKKGTALAASLQFALTVMKVPNLIVIGHTQCGAAQALADNNPDEEISSFLEVTHHCLHKAQDKVGESGSREELLRETEKQIVVASVENLKQYPSVKQALSENRLTIKGWTFDMKNGCLLEYDTKTEVFEPISL